jgi:glycerol-3-phosphate O-acyltransferase
MVPFTQEQKTVKVTSSMFETVEIPIWALVLTGLLALVAALDKILLPSVRWFFRRRLERAVARLNKRLERPIQPFKLARRYDTIQRLSYDPEVALAIAEHAKEYNIPEQVAFEKAQRYAREIVPGFSAFTYFSFAIRLAKWLSKSLYRVRLGYFDEEALRAVDPNATVIFVINHRSNMDYVLVTWLAAERSALAYAVGEWARVWPLQQLIRALGGYFIRRRQLNPLYRKVLSRYVQMATEGGVTQAVFPEGRLTLDGKLGAPKLGLLSYILAGFTPGKSRDVVFVPVGLNYDRVLEDRVLTRAADAAPGAPRSFRLRPMTILRYLYLHLLLRLRGGFHRFGYAAVSFGAPMSLTAFLQRETGDAAETLATELMARIDSILPVLPVPIMASVIRDAAPISPEDLRTAFETYLTKIQKNGHHVHIPRADMTYAAEVGLRALTLRGIVETRDGLLQPTKKEERLLHYYANMLPVGAVQAVSDAPTLPSRHKITQKT